jgi:hypothetical protein
MHSSILSWKSRLIVWVVKFFYNLGNKKRKQTNNIEYAMNKTTKLCYNETTWNRSFLLLFICDYILALFPFIRNREERRMTAHISIIHVAFSCYSEHCIYYALLNYARRFLYVWNFSFFHVDNFYFSTSFLHLTLQNFGFYFMVKSFNVSFMSFLFVFSCLPSRLLSSM